MIPARSALTVIDRIIVALSLAPADRPDEIAGVTGHAAAEPAPVYSGGGPF